MFTVFNTYLFVVIVTALAILLLIVVEIAQKKNRDAKDDINYIIYHYATNKYYSITLFFGIVTGHLFLGSRTSWSDFLFGDKLEQYYDVIIVAVILIITTFIGHKFSKRTVTKFETLALYLAGIAIGHFIWSMYDYV